MHILVSDTSQTLPIGNTTGGGAIPSASVVITTPWLRPRLEGKAGSLKGQTYEAKFADSAKVLFGVRLNVGSTGDRLNNFRAVLTIEQAPQRGQDPRVTFPEPSRDVSSEFAANDGRLEVDLAVYGTCRAKLTLTRWTDAPSPTAAAARSLYATCQVLAEERSLAVQEKMPGSET